MRVADLPPPQPLQAVVGKIARVFEGKLRKCRFDFVQMLEHGADAVVVVPAVYLAEQGAHAFLCVHARFGLGFDNKQSGKKVVFLVFRRPLLIFLTGGQAVVFLPALPQFFRQAAGLLQPSGQVAEHFAALVFVKRGDAVGNRRPQFEQAASARLVVNVLDVADDAVGVFRRHRRVVGFAKAV